MLQTLFAVAAGAWRIYAIAQALPIIKPANNKPERGNAMSSDKKIAIGLSIAAGIVIFAAFMPWAEIHAMPPFKLKTLRPKVWLPHLLGLIK